jgi:sulfhydrogenase subunit gamma (sulfur reductase)
MCNCTDTMIPQIGVVTDVCRETADVKTYRVEKPGGGKLFEHLPGQCALLSVPGMGEAIFSITLADQ